MLWLITGLITTLVAGYLIAHIIVLGRYFDWLIANGQASVLEETYAPFRREFDPVTPYLGSFVVQFILAAVLLTTLFLNRYALQYMKPRLICGTIALLCLPMAIVLFESTGFHAIEDAVMSASDLSEPVLNAWLEQNIPMHIATAFIYFVAAALLVLWPLTNDSLRKD